MPLELVKEVLEVDQEIQRFSTQTMVEENVIVPDFKPDIERILSVSGRIHVNNKVIEGNRLFMEGIVESKILYQTQEEGVKLQHLEAEIPFSHWIEVDQEGDMGALVVASMEYMDGDLINSRKVNLRAVLQLQGKITKKDQYPLLNNIKGLEDMQMLRNWVRITTIAEQIKDKTMVKEQIQLADMPPIVEIIKTQAKALEREVSLAEGRMVINGSVDVEFLYVGEGEEVQSVEYVEYQMPFAHIVELPTIREDMVYQVDFQVEEVLTQIQSNEEGIFNIVEMEVLIGINGLIYQDHEVESIVDAYSPKVETQLEKERISCMEMVLHEKGQCVVKEKLSTPLDKEGIGNILSVDGSARVIHAQRVEDQWVIEGLVGVEILYQTLGDQGEYDSLKEEIPFRHAFEVEEDGELKGDVIPSIHHMGYQLLNPDEVEVKCTIDLKCQLFKPVDFFAVQDVEVLDAYEEDSKEARISVYFKQPDDTLWEIAKRYRVTTQEIMIQNDIGDKDPIPNYTPLIIIKEAGGMV